MKIEISYKNLVGSENINDHFCLETEKIEKLTGGNVTINWTCSKNRKMFVVEGRISGPSFGHCARAQSENLFKTIDMVMDKLTKQLKKQKTIDNNKMHRRKKDLVLLDPEDAWLDYDEDAFADVG